MSRRGSHVAVVYLAGQRILGSDVGKHLLAEFTERLDQPVIEPEDLDALSARSSLSDLTFSALNSASDASPRRPLRPR